MARLYMIFSVRSDASHNDLMGIRQVVFDRLRETAPAVVAYGDLLGRTRLALSMYDHLMNTGADIQYERWSATMADLLDEWAGPID